MACHIVRIVRFVRQQDRRFAAGHGSEGYVQVGGFAQHIVKAAEPEASTIGFNRSGLIGKNLDSVAA